jgi:putative ABC transport system substrate-binding protein
MKRREFMAALGSVALWPLGAGAQPRPTGMPVIGYFGIGSPNPFADRIAAFRDGLRREGFVEGRNLAIEFRWAETYDQLPALAAELVSRGVDVIVTGNAAVAAKAATSTIPLVCLIPGDPIKSGLVASLNRPGSNLTGVSLFAFSLGAKRFEILHEVVSKTRPIGVFINPTQPDPASKTDIGEVATAAQTVGQQLIILNASQDSDFEPAFTDLVRKGAGGLLVMADPYLNNRRQQIVKLAARHAIPAIYEWRESAAAGGLMSYGSSIIDAFRELGGYTGKVLNGARPIDLPVMQAVKVEFVINLKTAKTLGISFPLPLLARADEVIE